MGRLCPVGLLRGPVNRTANPWRPRSDSNAKKKHNETERNKRRQRRCERNRTGESRSEKPRRLPRRVAHRRGVARVLDAEIGYGRLETQLEPGDDARLTLGARRAASLAGVLGAGERNVANAREMDHAFNNRNGETLDPHAEALDHPRRRRHNRHRVTVFIGLGRDGVCGGGGDTTVLAILGNRRVANTRNVHGIVHVVVARVRARKCPRSVVLQSKGRSRTESTSGA